MTTSPPEHTTPGQAFNNSPISIQPYSDVELKIVWNNGKAFSVPYSEIRFHCPCAGCVDEMSGRRTLKREAVSLQVRPTKVTPIGRYAIQISWNDGHSTGMFHYERLNELCLTYGKPLPI